MSPRILLPLLIASAVATSAHAEPLTFDQALDRARETAPSLKAASLRTDAARSAGRAAGSLPDPKLTAGVESFPISGPLAGRFGADEMTMTRFGIMQDMPSGAARRADVDRADAEVGVAQAQSGAEARAVRLETALAWVDLHFARERLAALDDLERSVRPVLETAPAGVARSERPATTLASAEWMATLADRRSGLVADAARARAALARWTGDPEADVSGPSPDPAVDPVALRAGLDRSPTLLVFDAQVQRADADLRGARASTAPDWSWELAYQRRDPMFGDMVSAGITVTLPIRQSRRQAPIIDARTREALGGRMERESAYRQLLAQLEGDLADHRMHHERWMRARDTRLPLAQQRADLETASYAAGTASLGDVLTAFTGLVEARLNLLDRQAETRRDAVRITITYGTDGP